jgi:5-methylthioadenosine/S-adenosylhomocysteine deaminase
MQVDELIEARWMIPIEPAGVVLEDHALVISGARIIDVLPAAQASARYPARVTTRLANHVLMPGLINLHTHAAMALLRGVADDMALRDWLTRRIWPLEKALMSRDFVVAGTRLACLEMLRSGVTCFNDMYFFPDGAAEAALEVGMRAALGITVIDFPTAWANDADDYLNKGLAVRDQLRDEPLLSFCFAPHAPYTVGDATFERVATLSEQLGIPLHVHLHETVSEIMEEQARTGLRPIERLERLGVIGPQLIAVHCVHLEREEVALFAARGVTVAHCPTSNLKLGSGIAPIAALLDAGVRVGLGTDGAASNNRLDVRGEMNLAALLTKGASGRAELFGAHAVLRAATLNGATALGIEKLVGSLEVGKEADLVAFDLSSQELQPCFDAAAHLVFAAGREHVSDVWVRGERVVEKRQFAGRAAKQGLGEGASALALWQNRVKIQLGSAT